MIGTPQTLTAIVSNGCRWENSLATQLFRAAADVALPYVAATDAIAGVKAYEDKDRVDVNDGEGSPF